MCVYRSTCCARRSGKQKRLGSRETERFHWGRLKSKGSSELNLDGAEITRRKEEQKQSQGESEPTTCEEVCGNSV